MHSINTLDVNALNCRGPEFHPVLTYRQIIYPSAFKYQKSKSPLCCFLWYGLLFFDTFFCILCFCDSPPPPARDIHPWLSWLSLTLVALVNVWILSMSLLYFVFTHINSTFLCWRSGCHMWLCHLACLYVFH